LTGIGKRGIQFAFQIEDHPGIIKEMAGSIPKWVDIEDLVKEVLNEALGLGPLEDLLSDDDVTEIMVNRKDQIYIEKKGKLQLCEKTFSSDEQVMAIIERIPPTINLGDIL